MKKVFIFLALICLLLANCNQRPNQKKLPLNFCTITLNKDSEDIEIEPRSVIETKESDYLILGVTLPLWNKKVCLMKVDKNGNNIWSKAFEEEYRYDNSQVGYGRGIIETKEGGYIFIGTSTVTTNNSRPTYFTKVTKYNKDGDNIWSKNFKGNAISLIKTNREDYVIAGDIEYEYLKTGAWLVKVDKYGNKIWEKTFIGTEFSQNRAWSAIETKEGDYVVTGNKGNNIWLVKVDKDGNKIWEKTFGHNSTDTAYSIVETKEGNYLVVGDGQRQYRPSAFSFKTAVKDISWLIKVNKDGNKILDKVFDDMRQVGAVIETKEGGYFFTGKFTGTNEIYKCFVAKVDKDGEEIRVKTLGKGGLSDKVTVIETQKGDCAILGKLEKQIVLFLEN